ncbi:hypothetical protein [Spirosoma endophyticum]|uniref:PepSY-associated TM region n=1 Tax=Spirosoma endophyticum TaxID=662367 RepID=A0A1I1LKW1_9BACT|nr:hypothetical protein [Spirosoma endophyticum]SFC73596.1 hypothetical protein SAMN05216167_102269 [Spirosoma endophyticum]
MKHLLIALLLSIGLVAMTTNANASNLKTRISDDNQTLSIQIDGFKNGKEIHYSQHFSVADMSALQKTMLKYRAFNSAGVAIPFHEISWLFFTALVVITLILTGLIVGYQVRKGVFMKPAGL